jgi:Zn-dependent protease
LTSDPLVRIIAGLPIFLLAIVLHEVAHGYVAYLMGDDTAKRAGRLTLSPLAHLDPLGALMFVLSSFAHAGFGWAKPVPVNPARLRPVRLGNVLVSIAGVAANFLQAVIWSLLVRAVLPQAGENSLAAAVTTFCALGIQINLMLMIFNLLPIPPLDGFHVITGALGLSGSYQVIQLERVGFLLLFVLLYLGLLNPVFRVAYPPFWNLLVP